jgi:signal transduction histidine kinase
MARVLHIEDDPRNRLLVRELLVADGHEVIDAPDGIEGVRAALAHKPDIVLVDLNIPGLDGYEVTLRLRSEASLTDVPIVAIADEGDRDTSFAVGCDGFLRKPIDARQFASTVRRYLEGHREQGAASPQATSEHLRLQSHRIVGHLDAKLAELSEANERLREMERLRREFYRNISHELATPMTPLVGYVRMLLDEELGPVSKAQGKALRAMDDCIRRLRITLDNLIDVTGLETGKMAFFHRPYDFVDLVRRTLRQAARSLAERHLELLEELPVHPIACEGDPERVAKAVAQLVDNAVKFTPESGCVGVRVRAVEGRCELVVADSGRGIPSELAERVFEPFYQIDGSPTRAHGGVGVGLALARKVARGHGGDLTVSSGVTLVTLRGRSLQGAAFVLTVAKSTPSP